MAAPSIARLGHVGIHCKDLEGQKAFYRDVLGLQVTNEDDRMGMVFLSARPEEEDHELLLCAGREVDDVLLLQQMSWRCNDLTDVIGFYERLKKHGVRFDMIVSHGNAVGMYFRDPEENRLEIYWALPGEGRPHRVAGRDHAQDQGISCQARQDWRGGCVGFAGAGHPGRRLADVRQERRHGVGERLGSSTQRALPAAGDPGYLTSR